MMCHFIMNNFCRICLSLEDVSIDIYESLPNSTPLCNRIYSALNIKLSLEDGLPSRICVQCVERINWVQAYRDQCSETQSLLQMYRRYEGRMQNPERDKVEQLIIAMSERRSHQKFPHPEFLSKLKSIKQEKEDSALESQTRDDKTLIIEPSSSLENENQPVSSQTTKISKGHKKTACRETNKNLVATVLQQPKSSLSEEHCYASLNVITKQRASPEIFFDSDEHESNSEEEENDVVENTTNSCEFCSTTLKSLEELKVHVLAKHTNILDEGSIMSEPHYSCSVCQKSFSRLSALNEHLETHNGTLYECPECRQRFKMKQYLLRHLMSHEEARSRYKCRLCGRRFVSPFHLNKHTRAHLGLKPHQCEKCGKYFSRSNLLKAHMDWHRGNKSYMCEICGKMISSKTNLNAHISLHVNTERSFQCDKCDKKFTRKHHLATHELTHSNERPYQCASCGATFKRSFQLQEHELIHSGERKHECEECGKSFTTRRVLMVHKVIHSNVKAHQCTICAKTFARRNGLISHMNTHKTTKEFKCTICGMEFGHRSSLSTHRKIHKSSCTTKD